MDVAENAAIDWLLEPENPAVRYLTLTLVLPRSWAKRMET
jgi:hypothetical protein